MYCLLNEEEFLLIKKIVSVWLQKLTLNDLRVDDHKDSFIQNKRIFCTDNHHKNKNVYTYSLCYKMMKKKTTQNVIYV